MAKLEVKNGSKCIMNKELQISQRGMDMPASPIRKLAPLAYEAEDRGVKIYKLNIGQPDLPTPQKALDALKNLLANVYFTCGNGNSCGHRLFAHVHHNGVAFTIKMG